MPDLTEYVDVYDTRTGERLTVPAVWIERNLFPHLSTQAPRVFAEPPVKPPAKTATKDAWVKYATTQAPVDKRLAPESAGALTVDQMYDYYTVEAE